jgi:hypothetical protein
MKRLLTAVALLGSLALPSGPAARGQDVIHYFNPKTHKNEEAKGTITEESPATVKYKAAGKAAEIAAVDVTDIDYQPGADDKWDKITWGGPNTALKRALAATKPAERKKELLKALDGYSTEVAPQVKKNKLPNRHVHFKIAEVLALLAEDDHAQIDPAIDALKKFKTDHGDGWQLVRATKMLARLLELKGDEAGAQATYAELADNAAAPKEVRQEFGLLVVRYLLRKGKHADAAAKAKAMLPADEPQATKLKVYLAACDIAAKNYGPVEKELKDILEGGADNDVKALARNTLGDYYQAKGDRGEAFWQYLWVDVQYNQDREELAKALYNLAKLYADVRKDPVRAKECLERLKDEKQFGGLEYHRKALAE